MSMPRGGLAAALAFASMLALLPASAEATFPGRSGEILLLVNEGGGGQLSGSSTVRALNPRTGALRNVAACRYEATGAACGLGRPRLGRDGRRVAAPRYAPGCTECLPGGVATFGIAGGAFTERLTPNRYDALAWAPDGRRLVGSRHTNEPATTVDDPSDAFILGLDGSELRRVTNRGDVYEPDWSSTNRLAYRTERGIMVTTRSQPRVVAGPGSLFPSWSPHASRIAYVKNGVLFTVAARGGPRRRLASGLTGNVPAVWAPDGRSLVFLRKEWVTTIRSDGRGARRVRRFPFHPDVYLTVADWQAR